jgi:translation initiation factor IF-2
VDGGNGRAGGGVRRAGRHRGQRGGGGAVLRRLADRIQPVARQPAGVHPADQQFRGGAPVPQPGAAARDPARPAAARRAHRRRRCRPAAVRLGGISLRRVPRLRRGPDGVPPPGSGRDGERRRWAPVRTPHRAGRARGRRGPAHHPDTGTPARHAAAHPGHRHRGDRCAVRRRLHPGDLRPDPRPVPGLLGQPVRAARPAAPVFPHRRPAEPAGVPVRGPGRHPRLHRDQAHRRGAAGLRHRPPRARAGARDQRRGVAGGHRRDPAHHHREQPGLRPARAGGGWRGRPGGAGRAAGARRPGPWPVAGPRPAAGPGRARG